MDRSAAKLSGREAFGAQSRNPSVLSMSDWWNKLSRASAFSEQ